MSGSSEGCLSERSERVPERRSRREAQGTLNAVKGKSPGALFFGYFLLGKQKKVTWARGTPRTKSKPVAPATQRPSQIPKRALAANIHNHG